MTRTGTFASFLPRGTRLGRYVLGRPVGVGGMAEIYLAHYEPFAGGRRSVVVKRLAPGCASDPIVRAMFRDEARLCARLRHPNVVDVFDHGYDRGSHYMAMEFVDGLDSRRLLRRAARANRRLPVEHVVKIGIDVAAGLHAAHELAEPNGAPVGLVHRDVSPANLLVSRSGEVKLIDFGVAKRSGQPSRTKPGLLKGKAAYMSPEQVRGYELDRRSDLFSLGATLFELLTGRRLFSATGDHALLRSIARGEVTPPSMLRGDLPGELEDILLTCLAVDPDHRYQTASDLEDHLLAFAARSSMVLSAPRLGRFVSSVSRRRVRADGTPLPGQFSPGRTPASERLDGVSDGVVDSAVWVEPSSRSDGSGSRTDLRRVVDSF